MSLLIRPADSRHLGDILDIINDAILNTTANYDYGRRTEAEHLRWYQEKKNEGFPLLVAERDGEILGFATYHTFKPKIGYRFTAEHSVYVRPAFHGQGVGTALLSKIVDIAKENGLHTLVGYIDAANAGSIRFHQKLGFEEAGRLKEVGYKFDEWLDLCLMQRIL